MYPDSVSGVHFLFPLIHRKSRFFSKFVNTYSGNKMGEHICFRRNERLATVNPYWRGNPSPCFLSRPKAFSGCSAYN